MGATGSHHPPARPHVRVDWMIVQHNNADDTHAVRSDTGHTVCGLDVPDEWTAVDAGCIPWPGDATCPTCRKAGR